MTSAVPAHEIPDVVLSHSGGDPITPVWLNDVGGVTYQLGEGPSARYLKWQPPTDEVSLSAEAHRLLWAARFVACPTVLDAGYDESAEWMLTAAAPGDSAVFTPWLEHPEITVPAVGRGLRRLHDTLPTDACPWTWSPAERISDARSRGIDVQLEATDAPTIDRAVVCHGDACCPNFLLSDPGQVTAYVDLGSLGVADRWADIAVAAMSTEWDYGPGWERPLVEAYGVDFDEGRMSFYQRLWDST